MWQGRVRGPGLSSQSTPDETLYQQESPKREKCGPKEENCGSKGRAAVQLLFLLLDTFLWEQHSAGSISSAGTKVLLATRSSGHFLCKRLSHLHCSAPGLALVTLFARIHDNAPSVNGNCCATASLTFQNIALSIPFCWQHISAGATLAPFLVYASWQAVECFTARACF